MKARENLLLVSEEGILNFNKNPGVAPWQAVRELTQSKSPLVPVRPSHPGGPL
jgi:hypothetical protein